MSPEEIAKELADLSDDTLTGYFNQIDANGNGSITKAEAKAFVTRHVAKA